MDTETVTQIMAGLALPGVVVALWQGANTRKQARHAEQEAAAALRSAKAAEEANEMLRQQAKKAETASEEAVLVPERVGEMLYIQNEGQALARITHLSVAPPGFVLDVARRCPEGTVVPPGKSIKFPVAETQESPPTITVTMGWWDPRHDETVRQLTIQV